MKKTSGIFIALMILMNACYFSLESYKTTIRNQWDQNPSGAENYFASLSQLNAFSLGIEIALIGIILAVSIWFIHKKEHKNLTGFLLINFVLSLIMFPIGLFIAGILDTAQGNFIQHQLGPVGLVMALFLYQSVRFLFVRMKGVME